jgi:hypothetical protein
MEKSLQAFGAVLPPHMNLPETSVFRWIKGASNSAGLGRVVESYGVRMWTHLLSRIMIGAV